MKAVQIAEFGGPENMQLVELPDPEPGDGEVLVDVVRSGVNFADTHAIRDDYLAKQALPLIPGGEVAGRDPSGRRVAAMLVSGGYAQRVAVHEAALVPIPDAVSDDQAAALLLQGLTALTLLRTSARLREGESVAIQAAGWWHRLARRPARQALRCGPSDRHGLERVEAGSGDAPGRRCRRSTRDPTI